jgi:hypothetical protein
MKGFPRKENKGYDFSKSPLVSFFFFLNSTAILKS